MPIHGKMFNAVRIGLPRGNTHTFLSELNSLSDIVAHAVEMVILNVCFVSSLPTSFTITVQGHCQHARWREAQVVQTADVIGRADGNADQMRTMPA